MIRNRGWRRRWWLLLKGREVCISGRLMLVSWINLDGAGVLRSRCIWVGSVDGLRIDLVLFVVVETRLVLALFSEIDDAVEVSSRRQISAESVRTLVPVWMVFCVIVARWAIHRGWRGEKLVSGVWYGRRVSGKMRWRGLISIDRLIAPSLRQGTNALSTVLLLRFQDLGRGLSRSWKDLSEPRSRNKQC